MAKQTLAIAILSCGGMADLMSEQEAVFLNSSLGLFRNVPDYGRATPRAQPSMVRAYKPDEALKALRAMDADILHLIAHGVNHPEHGSGIQVGLKALYAKEILRRPRGVGPLCLPEVVVSTVCGFNNHEWANALKTLGVRVVISSAADVTPANLAAFDMAFYSALLSQIYKGLTTVGRVEKAFDLADKHYQAIHADGSPRAKFSITHL